MRRSDTEITIAFGGFFGELSAPRVNALTAELEGGLNSLRADSLEVAVAIISPRPADSKSAELFAGGITVAAIAGASYWRSPEQVSKLVGTIYNILVKAVSKQTSFKIALDDGSRRVDLEIHADSDQAILDILSISTEISGKFVTDRKARDDLPPLKITITPRSD